MWESATRPCTRVLRCQSVQICRSQWNVSPASTPAPTNKVTNEAAASLRVESMRAVLSEEGQTDGTDWGMAGVMTQCVISQCTDPRKDYLNCPLCLRVERLRDRQDAHDSEQLHPTRLRVP